LSDRGTYLTLAAQKKDLTDVLTLYASGQDSNPSDLLLNPASVLLGARVCEGNRGVAEGFLDWMKREEGGQRVVEGFKQRGSEEVLYSRAPRCEEMPEACYGW
jgi:ABC-type tungstate transport system permease subunit